MNKTATQTPSIQLKNVKFYESFSEETNAFQADVFFNKKKVGYAKNDGRGGNTFVNAYPEMREQFNEFEKYCLSLPEIDLGDNITIDSNAEHVVDDLFEKWLVQKEEKKMIAHFKKGLCYGSSHSYQIITWKGHTIETILKHPQGIKVLKDKIKEVKDKGYQILNTNLPSTVL